MAKKEPTYRWKYTKDTAEKARRKPAWKDERVHKPAEVVFEPYKHKPTAVENWLGNREIDENEN